jgi:hypothetical protein
MPAKPATFDRITMIPWRGLHGCWVPATDAELDRLRVIDRTRLTGCWRDARRLGSRCFSGRLLAVLLLEPPPLLSLHAR